MKQLAVALLMFMSLNISGQTILKHANIIKITGIDYLTVANALLDKGYTIEKSDKELGTIRTDKKYACPDCSVMVIFDIRIKDSVATFKGKWINGGITESISNEKWPAPRYAFNAMNDLAKALGKPIEYFIVKTDF
jgi:DNA-directed RNA polymerase subunit RPC12/RpoP